MGNRTDAVLKKTELEKQDNYWATERLVLVSYALNSDKGSRNYCFSPLGSCFGGYMPPRRAAFIGISSNKPLGKTKDSVPMDVVLIIYCEIAFHKSSLKAHEEEITLPQSMLYLFCGKKQCLTDLVRTHVRDTSG